MNLRRAVHCGVLTCMITLAVPSVVHADNGLRNHTQTWPCNTQSQNVSSDSQVRISSSDMMARQETDRGHDSRDRRAGFGHNSAWWYWFWYWYWRWHRDHCVPDPPADVPEAPQVLMLSGSAVLTGGAALLIIRRRARNTAPTARA